MPCAALPDPPPLPPLPPGISITPSLPSPDFAPELCCKIPSLPAPPALPPLPLGVFNPAVAAVIDGILAGISAVKDALSINCAKE